MYKTLGFKWILEVFCPASTIATADRDEARNPQRFIHVTVMPNCTKKLQASNNNNKKMKIIIVIIFVIWTSVCYAQLEGEWIYSHNYGFSNGYYNLAQKKYKKPSILYTTSDSIWWTNLKGGNHVEQKKCKLIIHGDSLILKNDFFESKYWFNKNEDTLKLISAGENHIYTVFVRTIDSESKKQKNEMSSILIGKKILFDLSEVFPSEIEKPMIDTIFFYKDKFTVNTKDSENWLFFETNKNAYLLLNRYIFQIVCIDEKKIILRNYHGTNNNLLQLEYINN
jgi:hypothetical protein